MDGQNGLSLSIRREGKEVVVCVCGELDLATSQGLADAIAAAESGVDAEGDAAECVALDLSGVSFIDTEACKSLVLIGRGLAAEGRSLRVSRWSEQVEKTVKLLGLEEELEYGLRSRK